MLDHAGLRAKQRAGVRASHPGFWQALRKAPDADPAIRTRALLWAGALPTYEGDLDRSKVMLEEALRLARQRQDRSDIAYALT